MSDMAKIRTVITTIPQTFRQFVSDGAITSASGAPVPLRSTPGYLRTSRWDYKTLAGCQNPLTRLLLHGGMPTIFGGFADVATSF